MCRVCPSDQLTILHGKNFNVGHYMLTFQPNLFTPAKLIGTIGFYYFIPLSLTLTLAGRQIWFNDRYYWTQHFETSSTDLDLHSRSQECEKAKTSMQIISYSFQSIWMNVVYCWDLFVWWTSYSFCLIYYIFKGENPTYGDYVEKKPNPTPKL